MPILQLLDIYDYLKWSIKGQIEFAKITTKRWH